jgi:hypothetical protein
MMKKNSQLPPVLLARAAALWLRGRVHFPKNLNGASVREKEEFIIFRKVVVEPGKNQSTKPKALFKVYFCFKRFSPKVNQFLSLIPIPFIIAQPGFRSKTWMTGKETGAFHGLYEWDSLKDAKRYRDSFPLRLMKRRAVPETLVYEIVEIKYEKG